jgi:hypothetical protein
MHFTELRKKDEYSKQLTFPKDLLPEAAVEDHDDFRARWDSLGDGAILIRLDDGSGDLPDPENCDVVQQLAAKLHLQQTGGFGVNAD